MNCLPVLKRVKEKRRKEKKGQKCKHTSFPLCVCTKPQEKTYTIEDIYALPNGQRAELIAGQIYLMAPSARIHQIMLNQTLALSMTRIN